MHLKKTDVDKLCSKEVKALDKKAKLYKQRIEVHVSFDDSHSLITKLDSNLVSLVIRRILDNAVKYSRPMNKAPINHISVKVWFEKNTNEIIIAIRDEGLKISQQEYDMIFGEFMVSNEMMNKNCGRGIGLVACLKIIEAHKGRMWIENNQDHGIIVYVSLPYVV